MLNTLQYYTLIFIPLISKLFPFMKGCASRAHHWVVGGGGKYCYGLVSVTVFQWSGISCREKW